MSSEPTVQARGDIKKPVDDRAWTATFTFLDASGTISSSQLRRLAGGLARMWRLMRGAVLDRSKVRAGF